MEILDEYADKFKEVKYLKRRMELKMIINNSKENSETNNKIVIEKIDNLLLNDNIPRMHICAWNELSKKIKLSTDILKAYLNKWIWGKGGISSNKSLTCELLSHMWSKRLCWGKQGISSNPCITLEMIVLNSYRPFWWGNQGLSSNPSLTVDMLKQFPNKSWNWGKGGISSNPSLTVDMLIQFPDKKWNCLEICNNSSLTIEMIDWLHSHRKKIFWGINGISSNKNIMLKIKDINRMKNVPLIWGFGGLSLYFGDNHKMEEIKNKQKEYFREYIFEELIAKSLHPDRIIQVILNNNNEFEEFDDF